MREQTPRPSVELVDRILEVLGESRESSSEGLLLQLLEQPSQRSTEGGAEFQIFEACWLCDERPPTSAQTGLCDECRFDLKATNSSADEALVELVSALNCFVGAVRRLHPDVPEALVLPVPGGRRVARTSLSPNQWRFGLRRSLDEISVIAERLDQGSEGAEELAAALLFQCARAYAGAVRQEEPSRDGRYFSRYWNELFQTFGLVTTKDARGARGVGYIVNGLSDEARSHYAAELRALEDALVLERRPMASRDEEEGESFARARRRRPYITANCECRLRGGRRRIHVPRGSWQMGPIHCPVCDRDFAASETSR